ncbi:hypothetical protein [Pseudomonas sp. NY15354]|uniref:hypothetical protein n=1 Tax=Pseudomonas sp. NY15354 TaxID=3400351 RepID=UPI003A8AB09D
MPARSPRPQMIKADPADGYQVWPYRAEAVSPDGDRNNGGIDLLAEPHRIDEIHEATKENGLRYVLEALNSQDSPFMSLGCLSGEDGHYFSYVEFTLRDHAQAANEKTVMAVHDRWQSWIEEKDAEFPGLAQALNERSAWEYREFSLRGSDPQYLIAAFHREQDQESHGKVVEWFERFVLEADHSS